MLAVIGTIPIEDFPLVSGEVRLEKDTLILEGRKILVNRGTPALLAATIAAGKVLGNPLPFAYLVGDIGTGKGSRRLYDHLTKHLTKAPFDVITFHYLQPDVDWHNRVLFSLEEMKPRPLLIADAGFKYAAKMSGRASMTFSRRTRGNWPSSPMKRLLTLFTPGGSYFMKRTACRNLSAGLTSMTMRHAAFW